MQDVSRTDALRDVKTANNPEPRIPTTIIVDRSGSMSEEDRIRILNRALRQFKADIVAGIYRPAAPGGEV